MKKLSILGSSGSIGTQTLDVVSRYPDKFKVVGLSVNRNIDLLRKQIAKYNPKIVSVGREEDAKSLRMEYDIPVYSGIEGLSKVACHPFCDTVVTAIVGSAGLKPTIDAIRAKKNIAIANKETLVVAGTQIMCEADLNGVSIMPIDSEHSAIYQSLKGEMKKHVKSIVITCSGGSFIGKKEDDLKDVSVTQALDHPTWNMGGKITIDSATLMNKGFEVIEAHHLYNIPYERIEVVIHPQSIVHSMVEYHDGSNIAQLSSHDMRMPILYALSHPERYELDIPKMNLKNIKELTFSEPDTETFKCLNYAFEAGKIGGSMPCVLNASNEIAVDYFLKGKIKFLDIQNTIKTMMDRHTVVENPSVDELLEIDKSVKENTKIFLEARCSR